jgi:hypothetical protein
MFNVSKLCTKYCDLSRSIPHNVEIRLKDKCRILNYTNDCYITLIQ